MIFGDALSFRSQYTTAGSDLNALRNRLQSFCRRTLRRQVVEYIQFTERRPITVRFRPTDDEQKLYQAVSDFLKREDTISIPHRQRHLVALILRKLLASSSHAISNTLETMRARLEKLREGQTQDDNFMEELVEAGELEDEYLDEMLAEMDDEGEEQHGTNAEVDWQTLNAEIAELTRYAQ
jgi:signal transduction histidine kinase